jgi:hypothetical protein
MARYQVVAECAHVTMSGPTGVAQHLLLKGALVPADAPELKRLLAEGFVAKVGDDETGGVNADGIPAGAYTSEVPPGVTSTPVVKTAEDLAADKAAAEKTKADAEVAEKRAAARAKLPENGSAPDGRASKDVLVEYLAGKGYDYDELCKSDKADLAEMAKTA